MIMKIYLDCINNSDYLASFTFNSRNIIMDRYQVFKIIQMNMNHWHKNSKQKLSVFLDNKYINFLV